MENFPNKSDTLGVIAIGFMSSLLSECIPWLLVYRNEEYKSALKDLQKYCDKIDKQKDTAPKSIKSGNRLKHQEDVKQKKIQQLNWMRMKGNISSALLIVVVLPVIYGLYDGIVVAKLPFVPVLMLKMLAHQTLGGNDYTDCSMMFLYILTAMFFRGNLQRILGTVPPKAQNPMPSLTS